MPPDSPTEENQLASKGDWTTEDVVFLSLIGFGVFLLIIVSILNDFSYSIGCLKTKNTCLSKKSIEKRRHVRYFFSLAEFAKLVIEENKQLFAILAVITLLLNVDDDGQPKMNK